MANTTSTAVNSAVSAETKAGNAWVAALPSIAGAVMGLVVLGFAAKCIAPKRDKVTGGEVETLPTLWLWFAASLVFYLTFGLPLVLFVVCGIVLLIAILVLGGASGNSLGGPSGDGCDCCCCCCCCNGDGNDAYSGYQGQYGTPGVPYDARGMYWNAEYRPYYSPWYQGSSIWYAPYPIYYSPYRYHDDCSCCCYVLSAIGRTIVASMPWNLYTRIHYYDQLVAVAQDQQQPQQPQMQPVYLDVVSLMKPPLRL